MELLFVPIDMQDAEIFCISMRMSVPPSNDYCILIQQVGDIVRVVQYHTPVAGLTYKSRKYTRHSRARAWNRNRGQLAKFSAYSWVFARILAAGWQPVRARRRWRQWGEKAAVFLAHQPSDEWAIPCLCSPISRLPRRRGQGEKLPSMEVRFQSIWVDKLAKSINPYCNFCQVPSSDQRFSQKWAVLRLANCGPTGKSHQRAPVTKIQNILLITLRKSLNGRPAALCSQYTCGSIKTHISSLTPSNRPAMFKTSFSYCSKT